ncbi:MAG: hypothetical protein P4L50_23905 [Anaerolineaceae bacterium]|nr:hypothetical protein [Anaerolineaceae bacterium]
MIYSIRSPGAGDAGWGLGGASVGWGAMNNVDNPLQFVKKLKGAALAIIVILLHENKPVAAKFLGKWSGYEAGAIRRALLFLSDPEMDLVRRESRCAWELSEHGRQLRLLLGPKSGSRHFEGLHVTTTTTTTTLHRRKGPLSAAAAEGKQHFADSEAHSTQHFDESIALLNAAGIGEPTASELANSGWITPEYIRAHVENAKKKDLPVGLLIHKMRSNDPAPKDPAREESYRKYISGPYGDLIKH